MIDLHYEVDPPGRPPLLLVHGFLSSRHHWDINALAGHFRRILVDLPAHGLSPAPDDPAAYTPEAMVAALERVRQDLGVERWFVCGQSFGAGLTMRHALDRPERVIAQIFTNSNGALRPQWSAEGLAQHDERVRDIAANGIEGLRRQPFHPAHARRFPPDVRAQLSVDADSCNIPGIVHLMQQATTKLSVFHRLGETRVPTLLVNGLRERNFQPARDRAAAALPSMQVVDLDGGHSVNIEQPEAFDQAVIRFAAQQISLDDV